MFFISGFELVSYAIKRLNWKEWRAFLVSISSIDVSYSCILERDVKIKAKK